MEQPIEVKVTTDKKVYKSSDTVKFTMTAHNASSTAQPLAFSTTQRYDFEVREGTQAGGTLVWQWAYHRMFGQLFMTQSLAAGKTLTYTETFKPAKPLKPGSYTVTAVLATMPITARPHGSVVFTVK